MKFRNMYWFALMLASIIGLIFIAKGLFESFLLTIGIVLGMKYMDIINKDDVKHVEGEK